MLYAKNKSKLDLSRIKECQPIEDKNITINSDMIEGFNQNILVARNDHYLIMDTVNSRIYIRHADDLNKP